MIKIDIMFLQELSDKIWATKGARFEASKRMRRNRIASNAAMYLLSASIIAINLLAFLPKFQSNNDFITCLTLFTVVLSIFCLVITAIINSLNYSNREEQHHKCGLELDRLNSQIKLFIEKNEQANDEEHCKNFIEEYNRILSNYQLNHTHFDWLYNKYLDERENREWIWKDCLSLRNIRYYLQSAKFFIRWNIWDVYIIYWLIALLPIIGILYLVIRILFGG